ncbi:MAG: hypothetical protein Q9190_006645, partial [Brigantiaea leucoxantha]
MDKIKQFLRERRGRRYWCFDPISVSSMYSRASDASSQLISVQQFWRSTAGDQTGLSADRRPLAVRNPDYCETPPSSNSEHAFADGFGDLTSELNSASTRNAREKKNRGTRTEAMSDSPVRNAEASSASTRDSRRAKSNLGPSCGKSKLPKTVMYTYKLGVHSPPPSTATTDLDPAASFREQAEIRSNVAQLAVPEPAYERVSPKDRRTESRRKVREGLSSMSTIDDRLIDSVLEQSKQRQEATLEKMHAMTTNTSELTADHYVQIGREFMNRPDSQVSISLGSAHRKLNEHDERREIDQYTEPSRIGELETSSQSEQKLLSQRHGRRPRTSRKCSAQQRPHPSHTVHVHTYEVEDTKKHPQLRHKPKHPSPLREAQQALVVKNVEKEAEEEEDDNEKKESPGSLTKTKSPQDLTHDGPL